MRAEIQRLFRATAAVVPFCALRVALLRLGGVHVGRKVSVAHGVRVGMGAVVEESVGVGSNVTIGADVGIGTETVIGSRCSIGEGTVLGDRVVLCECSVIANAVIGNGSFIERGVITTGFRQGKISIGEHSYVGIGAVLDWSGGLEIGSYVHVAGPSVGIWTHSSIWQALGGKALDDRSEVITGSVRIYDNVWIGGNSTIYPGVTIERFAVVLPNSVVNRDVSTGTVVGGVPVSVKRKLRRDGAKVNMYAD